MLILGVDCVYHESSAALVDPARPAVLACAEEERFTGIKKAKHAAISNAHWLPAQAIEWCLASTGATWDDIGQVAYSYDPTRRLVIPGDDVVEGDWGSSAGEAIFQASLARVPLVLSQMAGQDMTDRLRWVPHHLAHAASAYLASPYDEAAVLSVDGIGETTTTWAGHGHGTHLAVLSELSYPHSLGFTWEAVSMHLGLHQYEGPGQLMGLAAWGDPDRYAKAVGRILTWDRDGFRVDNYWTRFRAATDRLAELFGPAYPPGAELDSRAADIAAALQAATELVLLDLAEGLRERTGATALCLAGGVALNAVAMGRLVREAGYADVFVQPAAGDAGTSLGAALQVAAEDGATGRWVMHPYLGPSFTDTEIETALEGAGLDAIRPEDITDHTAHLLAAGRIVGWFQGAAEAGPRALGNRSLLADPRDPLMRDRLNLHAKHRQYWRPYSPSILADHAAAWLDMSGARSPSHATMNLTTPVNPGRRSAIPAVVHTDGCTRAQTVTAEANPRYHELLRRFHRLTGVPMVLNTSLNGPGRPMVGTPADAARLFTGSGMDALVVGDWLVRRDRREP